MSELAGQSGPPRWVLRATAPMARAFAGRRWFPLWAVVHHRGRRSGTPYETPVAVVPTTRADVILIGLPWGPRTNWARNIVAAGGAPITWKGRMLQTISPRIVEAAEAAALARPFFHPIVARFPAAIVLTRE
ncbi:nitroreductase family deazaflavin-dependent oxidoreductase [Microbacterium sp. P5_E9]